MQIFITPEEAAEQIKVTAATVKTWIRSGELKAQKFGKQWRIRVEDWNEYLKKETEHIDKETEQIILEEIIKLVNQPVIKRSSVIVSNDKNITNTVMYSTEDHKFFYSEGTLYQLSPGQVIIQSKSIKENLSR